MALRCDKLGICILKSTKSILLIRKQDLTVVRALPYFKLQYFVAYSTLLTLRQAQTTFVMLSLITTETEYDATAAERE